MNPDLYKQLLASFDEVERLLTYRAASVAGGLDATTAACKILLQSQKDMLVFCIGEQRFLSQQIAILQQSPNP